MGSATSSNKSSPSGYIVKTNRKETYELSRSSVIYRRNKSQFSKSSSSLNDSVHPSTSTSSKSIHKKIESSLLNVANGITGIYISTRICKIGAKFWKDCIDNLPPAEQLEIACSIFFSMMSSSIEVKKIMKSSLNRGCSIEKTSLKYLEMMGWLIRYLVTDKLDLFSLLTRLGVMHQQFGVNIKHFNSMSQAIHETFSYYFDKDYSIEIKYALDEIFSLAAQIMSGQELKYNSHLMNMSKQFEGGDIPFLKNLKVCLASTIGMEYLYVFLSQTWCDEIVIFLKALFRFKSLLTDKERFMVARDIVKTCIQPTAIFAVNISYENRIITIKKMVQLNKKFLLEQKFQVKSDFFSDVEHEVYKLMIDNHWKKFVKEIQILQSKSFVK